MAGRQDGWAGVATMSDKEEKRGLAWPGDSGHPTASESIQSHQKRTLDKKDYFTPSRILMAMTR
jgi:hypothetical protein